MTARIWPGVVAAAVFGLVIVLDATVLNFPILAEDTPPHLHGPYLVRTALIAVSAVLACLAPGGTPRGQTRSRSIRATLPLLAAGCAALSCGLFVVDPFRFYALGLEDHPVEWGSVVFLLAAAAFLVLTARRLHRETGPIRRWSAVPVLLGLVLFVVAMEEISWFQRVLHVETPAAVRSLSERNELNVHNMATALFEVAYYVGSFVFLVAIPAIHERSRLFRWMGAGQSLLPGRTVALAAAPATALTYVFWNITFVQFTCWFTLALLVAWTLEERRSGRSRVAVNVPAIVLAVCVVVQALLLVRGGSFVRIWDATEYKELLIPLGFLTYSWELWRDVGRRDGIIGHDVSTEKEVLVTIESGV